MRNFHSAVLLLLAAAYSVGGHAAQAESVSGAQKKAAEQYLAVVSSAGAAGLAQILPQSELDALRTDLLGRLRKEDERSGATLRKRLFGSAATLPVLERQTNQSFFINLSRRLELSARVVQDPEWLGAIRDGTDRVIVIVRGRTQDEKESPTLTQFIEMVADGKDWKPVIPGELRVQIDDLIRGRQAVRAAPAPNNGSPPPPDGTAESAVAAGTSDAPATNPPAIIAMLRTAEQVLVAGKCDRYYKDYMSPSFRKTQSDKAMDTLIASCARSMGMRELLISSLRIVGQTAPRFEANGTHAVYDVSNQGLPYERFTLELIDNRWYIAE
jgi:hypothetical protein